MIADLDFDFRSYDKKQRLRTEALIEIYEEQAKRSQKQQFKDATVSQAFQRRMLGDDDDLGKSGKDPQTDGGDAKGKDKAKKRISKEKKKPFDPVTDHIWKQRCAEVMSEYRFDVQAVIADEKKKRKAFLASENQEKSCIPIIDDMNKGKQAWDMIILALAIVTSFTVGFELVLTSLNTNTSYKVFTYMSDFMFLIDIFVQFRTTFFSVEGEEVTDWKRIAYRYMRGMFMIDLIATIPWSLFGV